MSKTKNFILPVLTIIFSFLLAVYFYPRLPDRLVTHWGINGAPDQYGPKFFALFFMPFLSILMLLLFKFLPKTDPYKKNFKQFSGHFYTFTTLIFVFLFYIYLLSLIYNLGYYFHIGQAMSPALATLYFYAGILMSKTKRNWFVGIRTPWTISDKKVWAKTHRLGAILFKLSALLTLFATFISRFAFYFAVIPILVSSLFLFAYSYYVYQKIH